MSNIGKLKIIVSDLPKYLFVLSVCIVIYLYGYATHKYRLFPSRTFNEGISQFKEFVSEKKPHNLFPIRYDYSGAKIYKRNKVMPGVTLITSYWAETGWRTGIRLINIEGKVLHHWDVNISEIWPESPHEDYVKNTKNTNGNYIHGAHMYPNGDVVFSVEYLGLVRMNFAGDVIWKLPYRTHHSIFQDEEGYLWVSGAKWVESGSDRIKHFPGLKVPYTEETLLKVSPEGEIHGEISLLESLYKSDYQHLLRGYRQTKGDLLHLNDIEMLGSDLADQFPMFDSGDLVVSLRNVSLVAVLNQAGSIKWLAPGIFTRQHDPDFEEDGWISVFDNRELYLGGSKITKINPASGEIKTIYPTDHKQEFFTATAGKHQLLGNGNRLITEARAGRVFEVTPEGETVWEWIHQPFDENDVSEIHEGTRYSIEEQDVAGWK